MARIFLSYRRDDSSGYTGRLYDRLKQHFGYDNLFLDIDTIALGLDFVEAIQNAVGACDVLLAVIGRQWLTNTDPLGNLRLDNPEDFVRLEIETALERGIRVIPVLVGGASMPCSTELPDALQPLIRCQALVVGDHFHADVDRLIAALETVIGTAPSLWKQPAKLSVSTRIIKSLLPVIIPDCFGTGYKQN
jgi:TIR domain